MEFEDLVKIINDQIFVVAEKIEDEDGNTNIDLLLAGIAFSSTSILKSASFGDNKAFSNSVDHFCDVSKAWQKSSLKRTRKETDSTCRRTYPLATLSSWIQTPSKFLQKGHMESMPRKREN